MRAMHFLGKSEQFWGVGNIDRGDMFGHMVSLVLPLSHYLDNTSTEVYDLALYMPREEYGSGYGEVSRDERLKDSLQTLEHEIGSILSSEGFASYLQTLVRFHSYSFGNILLIRAQRPDATRAAGYRKWVELGRQLKKGEQGIKILVPFRRKATVAEEDGEDTVVIKGFGVGMVFDVTQTAGQEWA